MTKQSIPEGFLAVPPAVGGRGVLVLHAWWGLNDTVKSYCGRLAGAGYTAFAPDLYHGMIATTISGAEELRDALDGGQARSDIARALDYLSERAAQSQEGLGVIGFSLGAFFALELSVTQPERVRAVAVYYGTRPGEYSASCAAYLGHFADADVFESDADIADLEASLRAAGRPVAFHRYPGTGHWFCEPDRVDAYRPSAASLAWERTLAFLADTLPHCPDCGA